jgi:hypothetical protein
VFRSAACAGNNRAGLALILVLGAVGAWLTRDLWGPRPERPAEERVLGVPKSPAIAVLFVNLAATRRGRLAIALTERDHQPFFVARLVRHRAEPTLTYKDRSVDPAKSAASWA